MTAMTLRGVVLFAGVVEVGVYDAGDADVASDIGIVCLSTLPRAILSYRYAYETPYQPAGSYGGKFIDFSTA